MQLYLESERELFPKSHRPGLATLRHLIEQIIGNTKEKEDIIRNNEEEEDVISRNGLATLRHKMYLIIRQNNKSKKL